MKLHQRKIKRERVRKKKRGYGDNGGKQKEVQSTVVF